MSKRSTPDTKVEAVALLLAGGYSVAKAARESKCADSTVRDWLLDPAFRQRVERHRSAMTQRCIGILSRLSSSAAYTLGLLMAETMEPKIRHQAAAEILTQLLNIKTHSELVARLESLEKCHAGPL